MTMTHGQRQARQNGSILMVVAVFLAIASLGLVSIFVASGSHSRINYRAYEYERAFQLADAGIRACAQELNAGRSGMLDLTAARAYFAETNALRAPNWGFTTSISNLSATVRRVISVGTYGDGRAVVSANLQQVTQGQSIHSLYAHAIYAGNSSGDTNYVLRIGGTGTGADFVIGDVYSGNDLTLSGDARLRLPESFVDSNGNGVFDEGETRLDSGTLTYFSNAVSQATLQTYSNSLASTQTYPNGRYDAGEPFVDDYGNGVWDPGEAFTDRVNGRWDTGETWTEDSARKISGKAVRVNGVWDKVGGYWKGTTWTSNSTTRSWPAEVFVDKGNGVYDTGEPFEDRNGVYDAGTTDVYMDDRNGRYDYGTEATRNISGMPAAGTSQLPATGNSDAVSPPVLSRMYYSTPHTSVPPSDALSGWGSDVNVASGSFDSSGRIMSQSDPRHIFVKNPSNRTYTKVAGKNDYFIEDPTDASYGQSSQTITVTSNGNDKVYYVDGNVYLHNPSSYDFRFRNPGVKVTIVAKGNITLSDEFYYNGGTANPQDSLALIAMKDPAVANSGNILLGDAQFGTGGAIHAMLFAENNFVDNNLNTAGQPYLSVFGNMSAGNQVSLNRNGTLRTRLDVTLDERIVDRTNLPPGLPQALSGQRSISVTGSWVVMRGTWRTYTVLR